jgi:hypothetical protein
MPDLVLIGLGAGLVVVGLALGFPRPRPRPLALSMAGLGGILISVAFNPIEDDMALLGAIVSSAVSAGFMARVAVPRFAFLLAILAGFLAAFFILARRGLT